MIVPDDQLSLAIGKEGQNARLAARLTGMHIDIKNETLAADILRDLKKAPQPVDKDGDYRCEFVSDDKGQCRNVARPGSRYCRLHEQLASGAQSDFSDDPDSLI